MSTHCLTVCLLILFPICDRSLSSTDYLLCLNLLQVITFYTKLHRIKLHETEGTIGL